MRGGETIGGLLLLIPLMGIILIWFWVGSMNLLQDPVIFLMIIGIITIVSTAVLATYEANQLGFGVEISKKEMSPVGYFVGMILLWVVFYPIYLYQRSKKGKKNLVIGGIIVALLFAASLFLWGTAILEKSLKPRRVF